MINSKLTLCYCSLFLMTWSCSTAENIAYYQGEIRYKNYNGTLISEEHEKYPNQVCATILNETNAYWVAPSFESICSDNITCEVPRTGATVTLNLKPENGVSCTYFYDHVCLNGTCQRLNIVTNNQKVNATTMEEGSWTYHFVNFSYLTYITSAFRSMFPVDDIPPVG